MWTDIKLVASGLMLRCLQTSDVSSKYLEWLNDPEINRFLEIRHSPPKSTEELCEYIESIKSSPDNIIFGIFLEIDGRHIGNIKLGPINKLHKRADIGILFGERGEWGKGYATEAIKLISHFAFEELSLLRLTAGCYEENVGSLRAFQKAGFILEATLPNHWKLENGKSTSEHLLGLDSPLMRNQKRQHNIGSVDKIIFIGGGKLMLESIQIAQNMGFITDAFLAERHASEMIDSHYTLQDKLIEIKLPFKILNNVNQINELMINNHSKGCFALCFGPAWIFPNEIIEKFNAGMYNYNGIPLPKYLGGAHYTWQILNNFRRTGSHIQKITSDVDRGELLMSSENELPSNVKLPVDYFLENKKFGLDFIKKFLIRVRDNDVFNLTDFSTINKNRLYFPRLITKENGWIDWSWSGIDILYFCNAFSFPYSGASTFYKDARIFLLKLEHHLDDEHQRFHPFCSGLIIHVEPTYFCVAVSDGILKITSWKFDGDKENILIKEGDRLHTDMNTLKHAKLYRPKISGHLIN